MINMNRDTIFNLRPLEISKVRKEVPAMLVEGEVILWPFHSIRDQVIFTNKRIIVIDVQGLTGMRKSFATLPYSTIQFFEVQTAGFLEIFADAELYIKFADGFTTCLEFKANTNMPEMCRLISEHVLANS